MKNPVMLGSCSTIAALALSIGIAMPSPAQIVPTPTGDPGATGTIVTPINTQIDITGGTQAGSALFHSFTQFDVSKGQTANFQTPADIQNVLTRVTGGSPSTIDGTLQLSGAKANLYFMNPAGIVFGPNVNLNLPASFVGTTANSIDYDGYYTTYQFGPDYRFNASGENQYANPPTNLFILDFPDSANSGAIMNFGELSLPNGNLTLVGGAIGSTTDINNAGDIALGAATSTARWHFNSVNTDSSSLIVANRSWNFQQPGGSGINTTLNVGDIIVRNINTSGSITLSSGVSTIDGSTINTGNIAAVRQVDIGLDKNGFYWRSTPGYNPITVGNIQADGITIGTTGEIMAGHLKSVVVEPDSPDFRMMRFSGIRLDAGSDIQVSSLFAKGSLNPLGETHGGTISIQQGILGAGTFQATGTIPDADLGRISTDITTTNSSGSPISIAADERVLLVQRDSQITEGNGLERDSNGYAIYRLATNPDIRVDIVGVNPQDGGLILKNQATGEIIVGNKVVIQSKDAAIASDASGTQGLIVRLDRRNGSLVELSGAIKRQFSERPNALTVGGYYPTSVLLKTAPFSGEGFYESVSQPVPPDIQSANPIGGPLPGAYARNFGSTGPFPLTPELQTAVQKYEQTLIPIAQPSDPIDPTPTPAPTPIVPTPETIPAPEFSEASVLNGTIDPTDTINLSAGAIRGAAINPGGLLKVELDTSDPEGVLTRKVTTK